MAVQYKTETFYVEVTQFGQIVFIGEIAFPTCAEQMPNIFFFCE